MDLNLVRENYISTGSLYLCSQAFLFWALPETDELWTAQMWIGLLKKIYKGESVNIDKAFKIVNLLYASEIENL